MPTEDRRASYRLPDQSGPGNLSPRDGPSDADVDEHVPASTNGGGSSTLPTTRSRRASVQQWATSRNSVSNQQGLTHDQGAVAKKAALLRSRSQTCKAVPGSPVARPPPDAKITGPNQAAWECFKRIDADASGVLDEHEVALLVKEMKITGVTAARLRDELRAMDTVNDLDDGQVYKYILGV